MVVYVHECSSTENVPERRWRTLHNTLFDFEIVRLVYLQLPLVLSLYNNNNLYTMRSAESPSEVGWTHLSKLSSLLHQLESLLCLVQSIQHRVHDRENLVRVNECDGILEFGEGSHRRPFELDVLEDESHADLNVDTSRAAVARDDTSMLHDLQDVAVSQLEGRREGGARTRVTWLAMGPPPESITASNSGRDLGKSDPRILGHVAVCNQSSARDSEGTGK